jgi:hypothetical protein
MGQKASGWGDNIGIWSAGRQLNNYRNWLIQSK